MRIGRGDQRLTPAGAGSTHIATPSTSRRKAYPRRCGEHRDQPTVRRHPQGLPPQVWGAPCDASRRPPSRGLTPAGAGSTWLHHPATDPRSAYPRRCGEHRTGVQEPFHSAGLPPQVRGALTYTAIIYSLSGLTPAGAGSTRQSLCASAFLRAYPRRCGEHPPQTYRIWIPGGLPPQVRGAPSLNWWFRRAMLPL